MSHPLHGINPAAAALQARQAAAPRWALTLEPCPYSEHRSSDWVLAAGGPIVCGVCHVPAADLELIRRDERGFATRERAARKRQAEAEREGAARRAREAELEAEARAEEAEARVTEARELAERRSRTAVSQGRL
jgi:hypothetical protein